MRGRRDEQQDARAGDGVGGARGAERDERAAEQVADAGHRRAQRLEQADDPRLVVAGVASCSAVITAIHWMPLPAPPTIETRHATTERRRAAMPR